MAGELIADLRSNPIFVNARDETLSEVVASAARVRVGHRDTVLSEGDEPGLFVLLSGSVRVFHASEEGHEIVVKIFKPPAVFGEMETLVGIPFLENVDGLEESELLAVPRDVAMRLLERDHAVSFALLKDLAARFCIATHNEKALAFHRVRQRLASFLAAYAVFDGEQTDSGVRLRLKLTQDDMASALGVTRRAVASEIGRWSKAGLIALEHGHYVVRDLDELRHEAGPHQLGVAYKVGDSLQPFGVHTED